MAEYRNPSPTVDVVILLPGDRVVLVERRNPPPGWAIPGGFVDEGETVEAAAIREAREETGLDVRLEALLHVYSDPRRDPRKHTLSAVFVGRADGEPRGGDDAARRGRLPLGRAPGAARLRSRRDPRRRPALPPDRSPPTPMNDPAPLGATERAALLGIARGTVLHLLGAAAPPALPTAGPLAPAARRLRDAPRRRRAARLHRHLRAPRLARPDRGGDGEGGRHRGPALHPPAPGRAGRPRHLHLRAPDAPPPGGPRAGSRSGSTGCWSARAGTAACSSRRWRWSTGWDGPDLPEARLPQGRAPGHRGARPRAGGRGLRGRRVRRGAAT